MDSIFHRISVRRYEDKHADVRVGDRCGKMLPEFKLSARQRESGVRSRSKPSGKV